MPEGLLIAGAIVGLVGGTLGIMTTGWNLWDRIAAANKRRRDNRDYDINQSFH